MRSLTGFLGFGLVSIPVKLYVATEKKDVNSVTCTKRA